MASLAGTFIMAKPEGVRRGLVGDIIKRFEQKGLRLIGMRLLRPTRAEFEEHYIEHLHDSFFTGMIDRMMSGPVVAMVWAGPDAVRFGRALLGVTDPVASTPGSIRGDFGVSIGRSTCHGSDCKESAEREIALWFPDLASL